VTTTHAHAFAATPPDEEWDEFIARRKHKPVTFGSLGAVMDTLFDLLVKMKTNRDRQALAFEARIATVEEDWAKGVGHVCVGVAYSSTANTSAPASSPRTKDRCGSASVTRAKRLDDHPTVTRQIGR
jgi:hypothetical protein